MQRAVVVDAVRTPTGKRNGKLDGYHPVDLAATRRWSTTSSWVASCRRASRV